MNKNLQKKQKRATRIRSKVCGTNDRPRLTLSRSNVSMYAQVIDDAKGKTLVGMSLRSLDKAKETHSVGSGSMTKSDKAKMFGVQFAEVAKKAKITKVVFDKGVYKYHGRVKAFAEGAREGGLEF